MFHITNAKNKCQTSEVFKITQGTVFESPVCGMCFFHFITLYFILVPLLFTEKPNFERSSERCKQTGLFLCFYLSHSFCIILLYSSCIFQLTEDNVTVMIIK